MICSLAQNCDYKGSSATNLTSNIATNSCNELKTEEGQKARGDAICAKKSFKSFPLNLFFLILYLIQLLNEVLAFFLKYLSVVTLIFKMIK